MEIVKEERRPPSSERPPSDAQCEPSTPNSCSTYGPGVYPVNRRFFGHVFDKTRETYFCLGARAVDRDRRTAVRRRTRARVANAPGRRRGGGGGGSAVNRCDGAKRQDGRQARDRRQRAKQQLIVFLLHDARPPNGVGVTKTDRRKLGPSSDDLSAHTLDGRSGGRGDRRRLERSSESLEFTGDDAGNVRRKRSFISETTCRWWCTLLTDDGRFGRRAEDNYYYCYHYY